MRRNSLKLAHGWGKRGGFLRGIVKSSPERRKRIKVKEPKVFPGCLTDEEVTKLADACYTYRDRLIVMLLRETGVRRGELLGLHLVDVQDFDSRGRIRIVRRDDNPNGATAKGTEREIPDSTQPSRDTRDFPRLSVRRISTRSRESSTRNAVCQFRRQIYRQTDELVRG